MIASLVTVAKRADWENVKKNFLQTDFLQDNQNGILEVVEVRLIYKSQGFDSNKREYYWVLTPKNLFPGYSNIESNS